MQGDVDLCHWTISPFSQSAPWNNRVNTDAQINVGCLHHHFRSGGSTSIDCRVGRIPKGIARTIKPVTINHGDRIDIHDRHASGENVIRFSPEHLLREVAEGNHHRTHLDQLRRSIP